MTAFPGGARLGSKTDGMEMRRTFWGALRGSGGVSALCSGEMWAHYVQCFKFVGIVEFALQGIGREVHCRWYYGLPRYPFGGQNYFGGVELV